MTLLGNLFLAGTTLVFLYFLSFFYGPKPPTTGDAAVGTYWGIVYLHLLLLAGLTVVALAAVGTGGFDWLAPRRTTQAAGVLGGLVAVLLVSGLAAIMRYENGPVPFPFSLRPFVLLIPALLPLVLLLAGTVLLNESWRTQVPLPVIRVSLAVVLGIAAVGLLGVLATWATAASENAARKAAGQQQDEERWKNNYLEQIDTTDAASFEVVHLLVYTTIHQDAVVRQSALEKIKSNPDWQRHLVDLIEQGGAVEAFGFLAYNEVEDKALFAEPIQRATLGVAEHFRETIRNASHPAHFYAEQFTYTTDQVLLTLEQFTESGVDYRPAVRALRAALDEPSEHKTIRFEAERTLDRWLKKRS